MANWMIYGANGYTGRLIAIEAKKRGMNPVLAGRGEAVVALANELGFEARRFGLGSIEEAAAGLREMNAVLHCAGPFSATSANMLGACLQTRAHYLDITGEVGVFESIFERDSEFKSAGIAAIPGVGFDVVPTDYLARILKDRLPDASRLRLAIKSAADISPGTFRTMIDGFADGAMMRKDGKLVRIPYGSKKLKVTFNRGPESVMLAPMADLSTAFRTTGIRDIEVYIAGSQAMALGFRVGSRILKIAPLASLAKRLAPKLAPGPDANRLESGRVHIWGEAKNAAGKAVALRMKVPDGYRFTVHSGLAAVDRVLSGASLSGALTPMQAFGADFIRTIPNIEID